MIQIKGQCLIIRTEAIHLEDMTRETDLTVEDTEEQLGVISKLIRSLNDDIEQYRGDAQPHQATRSRDNQH